MSSAYYLTRLLESEPGLSISGSAHITVDARTAAHLAYRMALPADYVYLIFKDRPVKVALGITQWCLSEPDPRERLKRLSNWSARQGRPVDDFSYWGAVRSLKSHDVVRGGAA